MSGRKRRLSSDVQNAQKAKSDERETLLHRPFFTRAHQPKDAGPKEELSGVGMPDHTEGVKGPRGEEQQRAHDPSRAAAAAELCDQKGRGALDQDIDKVMAYNAGIPVRTNRCAKSGRRLPNRFWP